MIPGERKVALAFMAHPDDAEYLVGGTLLRLREAGFEVHIATATAGDCGSNIESPWRIAAIRTEEAKRAAQLAGAAAHCLGEPDGRLVYDRASLQATLDLFRQVAPTLVITHAPRDYHVDHEQASLLARQASFVHGAPNISAFPVLPGTCIPHLYYADPIDGVDPLGDPVTPTTRVDVTRWIDRKVAMLACHASQRDWIREHHGVDEFVDGMRRLARSRSGTASGYAEGFVQHRGHPFPQNDLLDELFGGLTT